MQSRDCMSSTARQPKKDNRDLIVRRPTREGELVTLQEVIHSLQRLLAELEPRLDSADNSRIPEMEDGLDFYAEVRRFEIELIRKALTTVSGHQRNAARLLKLKPQTLSMKMKQYQIQLRLKSF